MLAVLVVAREQRHDREALHRGGQVAAHEHAELVGLAFEAEHVALHLLVVLELRLEQLHHLDRGPGRAGDRDAGEVVGREHLVDAAVGDRVARGRPAVAGHHHAVGVADRDDRGAVRDVERHRAAAAPGARQRVRAHLAEELGERRARDRYAWQTAARSSVQTSSAEPTAGRQELSATSPSPGDRGQFVVADRGSGGGRRTVDVVRELADRDVAVPAEDAAHPAGHVIVIHVVGIGLPQIAQPPPCDARMLSKSSSVSPYFRLR